MGGPARVSCIWGQSIKKLGFDVELLSNYIEHHSISYKFNQNSIFKRKKNINFFNLTLNLFKILKIKRNEILIFNKGNYILPLFLCKILLKQKNNLRFVYYVHGGTKNFKTYYGNFKTKILDLTFDKIVCLYDNYDVNQNYFPVKSLSRKFSDFILRNYYQDIKNKIVIIPNPISFEIDNMDLSIRKKTILSVGRLDKIKRFDILIKAFNDIKNEIVDWNLEIAGDGEEYDNLSNLIRKLKLEKRVILLGEISNIDSIYKKASIFSLASVFEGMPMVILEALEYGLPVVGFKNDGTDFLIESNYNGLKSEIYDFEHFKSNLLLLAKNEKRRNMIAKNAKDSAKKFHKSELIKRWDDILFC